MTPQHRILTITWGLSVCLLSGCLSGPIDRSVRQRDFPPEGESAPVVRSDYQARDVPVGRPRTPPAADPVEPARLEVRPPEPPPVPPPAEAVLAEPPPPAPPAKPPDAPLVAALRCVLEKHRDEALGLLQRYGQANRDLLFTLLRLSGHVGEGELERVPPQDLAAMLDQLNTLALALRLRAPLALEKVCFCRKIVTFGVYDPLGPLPEFQAETPGRPGERVLVYAEVRNFASRKVTSREAGPYFETCLDGALEIVNPKGKHVCEISMQPFVDRSRTLRQDCFIVFDFSLPPLPAGPCPYTLWVQVKDVTPGAGGDVTPRIVRRSLDFRVGGGQVQGARISTDRPVPAQ